MKGTNIGEFEELVLLIIGVLDDNAYGAAIISEIESKTNRVPSVGAVHSAINRLELKGFIKSKKGETNQKRKGRRKIYYSLTLSGRTSLIKAKELRNTLLYLIPKLIFE